MSSSDLSSSVNVFQSVKLPRRTRAPRACSNWPSAQEAEILFAEGAEDATKCIELEPTWVGMWC